ncbi:hypothetical protein ABZV60_36185, partial [Streptomyces sp. NPDC004787]
RPIFYLLATCEIPEAETYEPDGFIGVDLGIVNIATTCTGYQAARRGLNRYRKRQLALRTPTGTLPTSSPAGARTRGMPGASHASLPPRKGSLDAGGHAAASRALPASPVLYGRGKLTDQDNHVHLPAHHPPKVQLQVGQLPRRHTGPSAEKGTRPVMYSDTGGKGTSGVVLASLEPGLSRLRQQQVAGR